MVRRGRGRGRLNVNLQGCILLRGWHILCFLRAAELGGESSNKPPLLFVVLPDRRAETDFLDVGGLLRPLGLLLLRLVEAESTSGSHLFYLGLLLCCEVLHFLGRPLRDVGGGLLLSFNPAWSFELLLLSLCALFFLLGIDRCRSGLGLLPSHRPIRVDNLFPSNDSGSEDLSPPRHARKDQSSATTHREGRITVWVAGIVVVVVVVV